MVTESISGSGDGGCKKKKKKKVKLGGFHYLVVHWVGEK